MFKNTSSLLTFEEDNLTHMTKSASIIFFFTSIFLISCQTKDARPTSNQATPKPFMWENASVYFMMTDRFFDGDPSNNYAHTADNAPAPYRGFMGGDIKGIIRKVKEGYFTDLGINAIWMTPLVEQIKGSVDEGTGNSFPFHGYWTRDWTSIDERFGSIKDLKTLVAEAHKRDIRIVIDVVANHTGPVTVLDSKWPDEWVKTGPRCTYVSAETTINCTLVDNLPDIKTEGQSAVELPPFLVEKWKAEGRYDKEVAELDEWFARTKYERTPVNYILKWLVDFIKEYGIDGFRVDTAKHTEADVWERLWAEASLAYKEYQKSHQDPVLDQGDEFYMVGEVYNYYISGGRDYNYGDMTVDFFDAGFESLINFDFKSDANNSFEAIFTKYDTLLNGALKGKSVLNYISSHDDGGPFDLNRERPIEAGTKLMLCPGGVQMYYGDELARSLTVEAKGDATLRSFMNWEDLEDEEGIASLTLKHWQKLGRFRRDNIAVGAGRHQLLSGQPYTFSRTYKDVNVSNSVVVSLDAPFGQKDITVSGVFENGTQVLDVYSQVATTVKNGKVSINSPYGIVLLQKVE